MLPAIMKLVIFLIWLDTAYAQHIKTVEKNFTLIEVPFDITKYNGTNLCGSIVSDRLGGICITWEALAALNSETSNNFGEWIDCCRVTTCIPRMSVGSSNQHTDVFLSLCIPYFALLVQGLLPDLNVA